MTTEYEVGYGKPPKSGQFKKGQSGNPKGRPKTKTVAECDRELREMRMMELQAELPIQENGKVVKLPAVRVVTRRIVLEAAKGKRWAIEMYNDYLREDIKSFEDDKTLAWEMFFDMEKRLRNLPPGEKDIEAVQLQQLAWDLTQKDIKG